MRREDGDLIFGVEQKLPLFRKPAAERDLAQAEHGAAESMVEYQFQLLRLELARAMFGVALRDEEVRLAKKDLAWLDTMLTTTEQSYRSGETTQVQWLRLQNERALRADKLRTAENKAAEARVALNRVMGRDLHAAWGEFALPPIAAPITYSQRLVNLAVRYEPKLKLLRSEAKQNVAAVELSRRQIYPDIKLGAEARNYSGTGDFREGMFTLSFNVPWGNSGKYRSATRREQAKLQAAEADITDYEQSVREEIHHLTISIDAARREAVVYREEILPRTERALASAQANWTSNRSMLFDVLEARRMLIEAELMSARAITEQYLMLSELVLCCGLGDLEALQMLEQNPEAEISPK
jgi:cobalt-zinc-cadmium efflux system outer membrane protein